MKLNDMNQFILDNYDNIIQGKFSDKFTTEQSEKLLQLAFILKHIHIQDYTLIFSYQQWTISIKNFTEILHSQVPDPEESLINIIRNQQDFKLALQQFKRDLSINSIID